MRSNVACKIVPQRSLDHLAPCLTSIADVKDTETWLRAVTELIVEALAVKLMQVGGPRADARKASKLASASRHCPAATMLDRHGVGWTNGDVHSASLTELACGRR